MALVLYTGAPSSLVDTTSSSFVGEPVKVQGQSSGHRNYVGLSNQGATCYLNSLLQTLFMTPEFRRAIFSWRYDPMKDTDEAHCIPLQLQKLFGYLAFGKSKSVDTVALTKSFGWEGSEVFQQQDVQELTRVLFDALEVSFKGTPLETIIDDIYAGELIDYIRCIDVDSQRERMDKFLDLSFAIVPFGQTKAMHSLSECIEMFLRPEMLDGDNQYYAEQFQKKVDAIKGLKFGKLPQIMSCNLKRFVYDFSGSYVSQKKLNDVVKFPFILDMNRYVCRRKAHKPTGQENETQNSEPVAKAPATLVRERSGSVAELADEYEQNDEFERFLLQQMSDLRSGAKAAAEAAEAASKEEVDGGTDGTITPPATLSESTYHTPVRSGKVIIDNNKLASGVAKDACSSSSAAKKAPDFSNMPDLVDHLGNLCPEQQRERLEARMLSPHWTTEEVQALVRERGEWVYELFAVLIHAGAISGGHYYAYIKNLDDHEWYNFNDSNVTHIRAEQVAEAWGSETSYTSTYNTTYYYPSNPSPTTTTTTTLSTANAYMLMYRKVQVAPDLVPVTKSGGQNGKGHDTDTETEGESKQSPTPTSSFPSLDSVPEYIVEDVRQAEIRQAEKLREAEELYNKLELKVWWKGEEKIVTTSRNQVYKNLLLHLWSFFELHKEPEFQLTDSEPGSDVVPGSNSGVGSANDDGLIDWPPLDRMRLRLYSYYKTGAETFDYAEFSECTLDKMGIGAYRPLLLETRRVTEQFEVYYVHGFNLEIDEFDRDTGLYKPSKKMRFPLGTTCTQFYDRLSQAFDIPLGSFRVFKCSRNNYCDPNVQYIPEISLERVSEDLKVSEYMKVGLERFDPLTEVADDMDNSPAAMAFIDERNRIFLRYNVYPSRDDIQMVEADYRWPMSLLRARIADLCNLPVNETRLLRGSFSGLEFKDDNVRLLDANIYDKYTIYVLSGKALPEGYYNICVSLFKHSGYKAGVHFLPVCARSERVDEEAKMSAEESGPTPEVTGQLAQSSGLWYNRRDSECMWADGAVGRGTKRAGGSVSHSVKRYVPADGTDIIIENPNSAWEAAFEAEMGAVQTTHSAGITMPEQTSISMGSLGMIAPSSSAASLPVIDEDDEMRALYEKDGGTDAVAVQPTVFDVTIDADPWDAIDDLGRGQRPSTPETEEALDVTTPVKTPSRACRVRVSDSDLAAQFDSLKTETVESEIDPSVEANDFAERKTNVGMEARHFENLNELDCVPLSDNSLIDDVKAHILEKLVSAGRVPPETVPRQLRLRSWVHTRADVFLKNGCTVAECGVALYEGRQLCVQVLDEPEDLSLESGNDVVVLVQKWQRSSWTLGECREVCLQNDMTLRDIATGLGEMMSIEPRNLRVLVVRSHTDVRLRYLNMATPRLQIESWLDPFSEPPTRTLVQAKRLFYSDLLIVQDVTEPLYELSASDKLSIQLVDLAENSYGTGRSYYSNDGYDNMYSPQAGHKYKAVGPLASPVTARSAGGIKIKIHSRQLAVADEKSDESKEDAEASLTERRSDADAGPIALFSNLQ